MATATSPLLFVAGPTTAVRTLRGLLEPFGFTIEENGANGPPDHLAGYSALVLDGRNGGEEVLALCRRLSLRALDDRPPLLYLAPDDTPASRLAGFEHGADAVIAGSASPEELLAQLRVLERWHRARGQWLARAAEARQINQQLQQAYQQIESDLRLARRLQASFLPSSLPAVGPVRFGVSYRPCGQVGGDFYDVFRLDEHHVGFYVADAMGHGVPASLLTIFLKKAVQPKEVIGTSYRLVPPEEVLARLNRDLIAQKLAEMPFITMVYGLLDCREGWVRLARAAHPYPVYLPREGPPEEWQSPGTLLGIFEAEYPAQQRRLNPGDKLLLFTDGAADAATEPEESSHRLHEVALAHREQPIQVLVERVSQELLAEGPQPDDFTLLGVEVLPD
jgi:sigma-B regulation protein RsbU (phosphoserine phosphatase)